MAISFAMADTSCDAHQKNSAFPIPKHHFAKGWESMYARKQCRTHVSLSVVLKPGKLPAIKVDQFASVAVRAAFVKSSEVIACVTGCVIRDFFSTFTAPKP